MPRYSYAYKVRIEQETLPALQELSASLGFIVEIPGRYLGDPSPAKLLDSLAAAYRRDPEGVQLAFKVLGVVAEKTPDPDE